MNNRPFKISHPISFNSTFLRNTKYNNGLDCIDNTIEYIMEEKKESKKLSIGEWLKLVEKMKEEGYEHDPKI